MLEFIIPDETVGVGRLHSSKPRRGDRIIERRMKMAIGSTQKYSKVVLDKIDPFNMQYLIIYQ